MRTGSHSKPVQLPVNVVAPNKDDYSKLVEGAWVHHRDGYYYMFYSGDNCCGDKANYAVMVARSKNATGPFERLSEAQKNNSSAILARNEAWLAPGHNSVITDDAGQDWIVYHAIPLDSSSEVERKDHANRSTSTIRTDGYTQARSPGVEP